MFNIHDVDSILFYLYKTTKNKYIKFVKIWYPNMDAFYFETYFWVHNSNETILVKKKV